MKLLLVGDMHLRVRPPRKRREKDFMAVCLGKLKQVLEIAEGNGCGAILQAGDFFHSPDPSKELIAEVIELLNNCWPEPFYCIHGQHDMAYHSNRARKRSALRVLEAAGAVALVDSEPKQLGRKVFVHGAAFGQDPEEVLTDTWFNVLVAHAMVGDKPLWPGHALTGPADYVRKHPGYDLYVLGDYHYFFAAEVAVGAGPSCYVINPGCLLRLTAGERDLALRPGVVIYDTDARTHERVELDAAPVEEAFDLSEDAERERPDFDALIDKLRETGDIGVNFDENLQTFYREHGTPKEIQELIAAAAGIMKEKRVG